MLDASKGIVYITYGAKAKRQMLLNRNALKAAGMNYPITVIDEKRFQRRDAGGRWAKLNLDTLSPYEQTLYLDADTRVMSDISVGWDILNDGFDLVITPSTSQEGRLFQHIDNDERDYTFDFLCNPFPLQLQGGVFWFSKSERMNKFFQAWRKEWELYQDQDQAALLRALDRVPIKIWILSSEFNNGSLVIHYFGQARE